LITPNADCRLWGIKDWAGQQLMIEERIGRYPLESSANHDIDATRACATPITNNWPASSFRHT
jgi:hypothetical protein